MKGIVVTRYAKSKKDLPHVLEYRTNLPTPTLVCSTSSMSRHSNDTQVLLRVISCAFNLHDYKLLFGSNLPLRPQLPYIPIADVCGIIEDMGIKAAEKFDIGDYVITSLQSSCGGLSEVVIADSQHCMKIDNTIISPSIACTLPTSGVLAMKALEDAAITENSKLLVLGASSGVGTFIIQLANQLGCKTIGATTTSKQLKQVLNIPKLQVIDSTKVCWYKHWNGEHFDAIIDCIGKYENWMQCDKVLKANGIYVTLLQNADDASNGTPKVWKFAWKYVTRSLWPFGVLHKSSALSNSPTTEELEPLVQLVTTGQLKPILVEKYPKEMTLENVLDAFHMQMTGQTHGKLVLVLPNEETTPQV